MGDARPPWWMLALGGVFVAYLWLLGWSDFRGPERFGIVCTFNDNGVTAQSVAPGSPAGRAGVRSGDRLLTLDGRTIRNPFDWLTVLAHTEAGQTYRLELERGGRRFEATATLGRATSSAFGSADTPGGWVYFAGARVVPLLLAFVIAFGRPNDLAARIGAWLLASIATAAEFAPPGIAAVWRALPGFIGMPLWIPFGSMFLVGPLLLSFFAIFPRKLIRSWWLWALVWSPAIAEALALAPLASRFIYEGRSEPDDFARIRTFVPVPFLYVVASVAALALNYRRLEQPSEKRRLRVLMAGALVGLLSPLPGFVAVLRSGPGAAHSVMARAGSLLFLAFPFAFAYALLRQRLFDVRLLVRQGLRYALARRVLLSVVPLLAGLLAFDLLLHGDEPLFAVLRGRGPIYAALGGFALVAQSRRERWLTALDRRFFRERFDASRLLRQVVEEAGRARSLTDVADRVVAAIETALHPEFVALLVREDRQAFRPLAVAPPGGVPPDVSGDDKLVGILRVLGRPLELAPGEGGLARQLPPEEVGRLRQAKLELVIPIALGATAAEALLALGVKRSEEPYGSEDQALLAAVAASLAPVFARQAAPGPRLESGETKLLANRYRLGRELGRGGMGTVYAATDALLGRDVAVKLIREDRLGSGGAAERFHREAQAAAAFAHPNVVTVHDFGLDAGGRAFLVMELLQGHDLRDELRRQRRVSPVRTLDVLGGVCAAVDAAHRQRLVHRDLKPSNVFLAQGQAGEVSKVLDFGVAKLLLTAEVAERETATRGLAGTPRYMAPEQLAGGSVQPAWDLWALAVMAYEMLTGAYPFAGCEPDWTASLMTGRFVPIKAHRPDAPESWQAFFSSSLALDPARRPVSGAALLASLAPALGEAP